MASEFPDEPGGVPPQPVTPSAPAGAGGGMIGRIQRLVLNPVSEWPAIDAEPMPAKSLFLSWAVPLAAIGPIAAVIGFLLFAGSFFTTFAVIYALVWYALSLAATWAMALAVDALAPNFGGAKNFDQAMKLTCFSLTPAWLAAVLSLAPSLAWIGLLIGLYSIYLLWVGLPILMKSPADKAPGYVVVAGIIGMILMFAAHEIAVQIAARFLISSVFGGMALPT